MPRIVWVKVAKKLESEYVDIAEGKRICKICKEEIPDGETRLATLANIYRHFKANHADYVTKAKEGLSQESE